jgi:predicted aspartyl protease
MDGVFNHRLEAVVAVPLVGRDGRQLAIEAIIDTGFTGFLTINSATAAALGFPIRGQMRALLADGSETVLDVCTATATLFGVARKFDAQIVESTSLVGMKLLQGTRVSMYVVERGRVEIRPEPTKPGNLH